MTVVLFGSIRGAPGVTATTLLTAGCLAHGTVAEADPDGGVLAVRYQLGREPGLTTLAADRSIEPDTWRRHAQSAGGVPVLLGPDAPARAIALWDRAGQHLASLLARSGVDVLVDAGRYRPGPVLESLLPTADLAVVLVRPDAEDLIGLSHRLPDLRAHGTPVGVVLAGRGPYTPADVAQGIDAEFFGTMPEDRRAADMLSQRGGSTRALARTSLARAARSLADAIAARVVPVPAIGRPA